MKYVTSLERDALEEGFEKGIVQGKKLGVVDSTDLYQANLLSRERLLLSYLPVTRDWCFFAQRLMVLAVRRHERHARMAA